MNLATMHECQFNVAKKQPSYFLFVNFPVLEKREFGWELLCFDFVKFPMLYTFTAYFKCPLNDFLICVTTVNTIP